MASAVLHIKNMVCNRCIAAVQTTLESLHLHPEDIKLGEVLLKESENQVDVSQVRTALAQQGFELLDDKKSLLIEKIKNLVIDLIHHQEASDNHTKFSYLIEEKLGMDYAYLSNLFSSTESVTIEKYIILQRVERVKELLLYDELTLSEIAWKMGYSSVQHLSNQFKKITGLTPSHFKKIKENKRRPLDEI